MYMMKVKPVIIVIVILAIGFVLGMLTSAQIRLRKMEPVRFYISREHFRDGFYKSIQADEKQIVELDKIFDKYEKLNFDLLENYRKGFEQNMEDMQKDFESVLTREQQNILREFEEKRQQMFRDARKNFENDSLNRRFDRRDRRPGGPPDHRPFPGNRPPDTDYRFRDQKPMLPPAEQTTQVTEDTTTL